MPEAVTAPPAELTEQTSDLVLQVNKFLAIDKPDRYVEAETLAKALKAMENGIESFWKPLKIAAKKAHQNLCDEERRMLTPVIAAIDFLDRKIQDYLDAEEAKRREQERQAQELAKKAEEERLLAEAAHLSEIGLQAEADQLLNEAIMAPTPAVIVASSVPKIAGSSQRHPWQYRIVDVSKIKPEFMMPDEQKIGQIVRAMKKQAAAAVGGIEVYQDTQLIRRS